MSIINGEIGRESRGIALGLAAAVGTPALIVASVTAEAIAPDNSVNPVVAVAVGFVAGIGTYVAARR